MKIYFRRIKQAKDMNRQFTKEEIQITSKHIKRPQDQ